MKNKSLSLSTKRYVFQEIEKLLTANPEKKYFFNVSEKAKKRGLSANGQQHIWYQQIAEYHGEGTTALQIKNMCKDLIGLPILLQSDSYGETIEFLLHKLDYYKHSYESKMKLIQCLSVTSEFTTKESKQYMDQMIYHFNDLGIPIKFKDE